MNLVVCSGPNEYGEGFMTLDADPSVKPHFCATVPPLPWDVKIKRWESIFLIHGIEHFHVWDVPQLLADFYEVLEPGGTLVMEQPNIDVVAYLMPHEEALKAVYGDPRNKQPLMGHKWGWSPTSLTEAVKEAGFKDVKCGKGLSRGEKEHGGNFRLEATK